MRQPRCIVRVRVRVRVSLTLCFMTVEDVFYSDTVENLTARVDTHKPTVSLKWDPPANAGVVGDVIKYQVRFWDKKNGCYNEKLVDGSTTTTVITRESGLRPLTPSTFEVRACSGGNLSQEWRTVSTFVGM